MQKGTAMRLLNVCPFKVGDVVYWEEEPDYHTKITQIKKYSDGELSLFFTCSDGRQSSWYVNLYDPNHSGIRLVKRGDE